VHSKKRGGAAGPEFSLVVVGTCERTDEANPVVDGVLHEVTQIAVHDQLEAENDTAELSLQVIVHNFFIKLVTFRVPLRAAQTILNFADQKLTPSVEHIR